MTLRPFAACLGAIVALTNLARGAFVLWLTYNVIHLTVRFLGVGWGYRGGPDVLGPRLRGGFERLTRMATLFGCIALGVLTAMLLAPAGEPRPLVFQVLLMAGIGVGFVVAQRPRPSPTEWALGAALVCTTAAWIRGV